MTETAEKKMEGTEVQNEAKNSAAEYLRRVLEALYIGNLNTVDSDLILPTEGEGGVCLSWTTSEERFIAADGTVHRPLFGMGNRTVELAVTAEKDGVAGRRVFEATVLQEAKRTAVREILPVEKTAEPGMLVRLPSVVIVSCEDGRLTTMPVEWSCGTGDEPGTFPAPDAEGEYTYTGSVPLLAGQAAGADGKQIYEIAEGADPEKTAAHAIIHVVDPREEARRQGERWNEFLQEPVYRGGRRSAPMRQLQYFSIREIRLLPDTAYYRQQQLMNEWLMAQDEGQMLYAFRRACGLPTEGAASMTGWDAEDCKLRGHTTGHYLSGLALGFGATGNVRLLRKIDAMVKGLAECQDAFAASGKAHRGFLSAYSEEQFDLLEKFTKYPEIWAPYYTLDKIMSGLYDCYTLADRTDALEVLLKMGDWVYWRLSRLSKQTLDRMWSMYIAGEFGGMLGTMVRLYRLSGRADHLLAAKMFSNEKLFYPMEQNADTLEDMHANQHIPQIIGAMELYDVTGEEEYWRIAWNFWRMVTEGHTYCNGGVGETEMFHGARQVRRYLTEKAAESCASYNMLRLTGLLFPYRPDGDLMDYYENTLENHILTSASREADGGTTYFLPLCPGGRKEYSTAENTCCHGTGMESRYRYQKHIFAWDEEYIYINLPVSSALHSENVHLDMEVRENGRIVIQNRRNLPKDLRIHIPAWARETLDAERSSRVKVNGRPSLFCQIKNGYLEIPGGFLAGDNIEIRLPAELRAVPETEDAELAHLAYGGRILAELSEDKEYRSLPDVSALRQTGDMTFTDGVRTLIPLSRVDREAYHVYFKK